MFGNTQRHEVTTGATHTVEVRKHTEVERTPQTGVETLGFLVAK